MFPEPLVCAHGALASPCLPEGPLQLFPLGQSLLHMGLIWERCIHLSGFTPQSRDALLAEASTPPLKSPRYRCVALDSSSPALPATEAVTRRLAQGLVTSPALWISALWNPVSRKTEPLPGMRQVGLNLRLQRLDQSWPLLVLAPVTAVGQGNCLTPSPAALQALITGATCPTCSRVQSTGHRVAFTEPLLSANSAVSWILTSLILTRTLPVPVGFAWLATRLLLPHDFLSQVTGDRASGVWGNSARSGDSNTVAMNGRVDFPVERLAPHCWRGRLPCSCSWAGGNRTEVSLRSTWTTFSAGTAPTSLNRLLGDNKGAFSQACSQHTPSSVRCLLSFSFLPCLTSHIKSRGYGRSCLSGCGERADGGAGSARGGGVDAPVGPGVASEFTRTWDRTGRLVREREVIRHAY
ncbi:hypothetical protein Cadr_000006402 [Camelus dromedarius]|uniref:Uncharacterized protein n=1 Tax=Camelus dromedarius TaxID=9838 RepID=A0A5N4E179_CAMDR|nr:hypothetical protein Cadr_000006402 [Camelus dromedarius]